MASTHEEPDRPVQLTLGHDELTIRDRYETLSIANDVLMALFFVVGSAFFFFESLQTAALWMFLLGSVDFLMRPAIRLTRRFHLQRIGASGHESSQDF